MKRIAHLLGFVILTGLVTGIAVAQDDSLAEAARQHRKQKEGTPTAKHEVFTNDNLPRVETISTVGASPSDTDAAPQGQTPPDADADKAAAKDGKDAKAPEIKVGDSAADRQKAWEAWRDKIGKQKETVEHLQKDTEQMEKDNQLRMNTYIASGTRQPGTDGEKEERDRRRQKDTGRHAGRSAPGRSSVVLPRLVFSAGDASVRSGVRGDGHGWRETCATVVQSAHPESDDRQDVFWRRNVARKR
jgi:hypothetical protein